jgi:hypothetical protein
MADPRTTSPAAAVPLDSVPNGRGRVCPACQAPLRGRYCGACGALGEDATCTVCGGALAAGDRFCSGCGASVRTEPVRTAARPARLTWLVVGGAVAAVLIVTVVQYAQRRPETAPTTEGGMSPGAVGPPATAPDISSMTAQQQADRLFDRIMRLKDEGKVDSVRFFVPMALAVYQRLGPLNPDQRYDLGTVANAAGIYDLGRVQADSILRENPAHLLGLVLAIRSAVGLGQSGRAEEFRRRLMAAEDRERQSGRVEYSRHANDIREAIVEARRGR